LTLVRFHLPQNGGLTNLAEQSTGNSPLPNLAQQEGGAIPIEPLRPGDGPFAQPTPHRSLASTFADRPSTAMLPATHGNASRMVSTLYGETARAVVFAMTGGEPAVTAQIAAARRARANDALSQQDHVSAMPVAESHIGSHAANATTAAGRENRSGSRTVPMSVDVRQLAHKIAVANVNAPMLLASAEAVPTPSAKTNTGGPHAVEHIAPAPATGAMEDARSAAFEQFDSAVPLDSAGGFLPKTLAATPLLVVWALERIAATNSRRSARARNEARR
jgi:hypothetical protein